MNLVSGPATYRIYRWLWASLDWLFPPRCAGCDTPGNRWCPDCVRKTTRLPAGIGADEEIICPSCGAPVKLPGFCVRCQETPPAYQAVRSWGEFGGPVRNAIHQLKYKRDIALGDALGQHLIDLLRVLGWEVDIVVPIPLAAARRAERGYNQAALLARPIALALGLDYSPGAVLRVRETQTQVGLNLIERQKNVKDAFRGNTKLVRGKSILLVDDVMTTGATLNACANALQAAGAVHVFALTLARAIADPERR
ncbi:MAG: ComF family protein [Anaerolineales bacterium]|nr:ComF family protein [Anaerolineales bacterium]